MPEPGVVNIAPVYDPDSVPAGRRVLVARRRPEEISAAGLEIDVWVPQVAPSEELQRWFDGGLARWSEFVRRYGEELASEPAQPHLRLLEDLGCEAPLVLLHDAADREHNHTVVLQRVLAQRIAGRLKGVRQEPALEKLWGG